MIYDCFIFFNEIDVLYFRLKNLYNIVDYFIILDANTTFQGEKKDFLFIKYKDRFNEFKDKIIYKSLYMPSIENILITNPDYKQFGDTWKREYYQRDYIVTILKELKCTDSDIIFLSDIDEILYDYKLKNIINLLNKNPTNIYLCHLLDIKYYLNNKKINSFFGNIGMKYNVLKNLENHSYFRNKYCFHRSIEDVTRIIRQNNKIKNYKIVENAGIHMSSYGGLLMLKTKLLAYSHTENNIDNKRIGNDIPISDNKHNSKKYRESSDFNKYINYDDYFDIDYNKFDVPDYIFEEIRKNKEKYSKFFIFKKPILD